MTVRQKVIQVLKTRYFSVRIKITSFTLTQLQKIGQIFGSYTSRLSSELRILLPVLFLSLILANFILGRDNFETNKLRILQNPKDSMARLSLAQDFLKTNQVTEAKSELETINRLQPQITANLEYQLVWEKITKTEAAPGEIKTQIIFWEKVVSKLPGYRDAYLKLAILNWRINNLFAAQRFLQKSLAIDPNNEVASKLRKLF